MKGYKVVTAQEMARLEELAYEDGSSAAEFMENAGKGVAEAAENYVLENHLEKKATLLIGKGNNGGDAYAAGRALIEMGFAVSAYHLYSLDECSPLSQDQSERFKKAGGNIHFVYRNPQKRFDFQGVILDGLVGTGFKGKAEGVLAQTIDRANFSNHPILAIDIPSGLNGTTGEVGSVAIRAEQTIF